MATTIIGTRRGVRALSAMLTSHMLDQVEAQLDQFFKPVTHELLLARDWGRSGLLDLDNPEQLNRLFVPLVTRYPQIGSVLIADSRGREHMLLRTENGWTSRQTRRDTWKNRTRWLRWTGMDPTPIESWKETDYDPRQRPWYIGAINRRNTPQRNDNNPTLPNKNTPPPQSDNAIHWTPPYTFFTTKDPGITAAVTFDVGDGIDHVVGFDVLLDDISQYTTRLKPSGHGFVVVLTEDARIVGLPGDPRFMTKEGRKEALLKRSFELDLPLAADAATAFRTAHKLSENRHEPPPDAIRFTSGGEPWWGQARRLQLADDRSLITAVVVSEAELLSRLPKLRVWIIIITACALLMAILRAAAMAKRVSQPIEALVDESDRISNLDLEEGPPIQSTVTEIRRLTSAHNRMRQSLQSLLKLERDLQVARQIQENTFPKQLPKLDGFDIAAWSKPADETGGDTYDVIGYNQPTANAPVQLSPDRADHAVLLLADATGHGIGPALSVTQLRAMLRMAIRMDTDLAKIILHMNEQLCADLPGSRFITAWLGKINTKDHTLTSFSAGQAPLLRYNAKSNTFDTLPSDKPPLGILPDLDITIAAPHPMQPGDIFAVISDGIYEAANANGDRFGNERVIDTISNNRHRSSQQIVETLRDAVSHFTENTPTTDDQTGIIIKRV